MEQDIRSGNLSVVKMTAEIQQSMYKLQQLDYIHKRARRQLSDGENFLKMIGRLPYRGCKTISDLKKKISEEREKLKQEIVKLDVMLPGHQFSIFENPTEVTEKERIEVERKKKQLEQQVRWLHKCLGMCSNRNYFK